MFSKPFMYSKETFNNIKRITEQEEIDLFSKIPSKELINLFTIIYIILEESYLHIPTSNIIINLSQTIMPKINVQSISKFYFFIIYRIFTYSNNSKKN